MQIGQYYFSKRQTITLALLVIGMVVGLTLVQREQIIKTKASVSESYRIYENYENRESQLVAFQGTYPIKTFDVTIESTSFENRPTAPVAAKVVAPAPKTSLAQCRFTRSGVSSPYRSLKLLGWIEEAARRNGVPPAIMASFAKHESGLPGSADDNDPAIQSNYYCNPGQAFCQCKAANGGAYNAHMGTCNAPELNSGCRTGQAIGLMQIVDIQHPDLTRDQLCTLSTNIDRGTRVFISKLSGPANNEWAVKRAVCRYFGIDRDYCDYGGYDYAGEVWKDYLNCPAGH